MSATDVRIISRDALPPSEIAREFVGEDHGGVGVCVILVDAPPGARVSLHRHPYEEVFITQEGTVTFLLGEDERRQVGAGEVVVVPAGQWHGFVNEGDGPLRQIDIHVSPRFETEWLQT